MEYIIVLLPLFSSIISGFFGKKIGDKYCLLLASILVGISAILSLIIFYKVLTEDYIANKMTRMTLIIITKFILAIIGVLSALSVLRIVL